MLVQPAELAVFELQKAFGLDRHVPFRKKNDYLAPCERACSSQTLMKCMLMPEHFRFFSFSFLPFCTKNVWCVGCFEIQKITVWEPNLNRLLPKLKIAYHQFARLKKFQGWLLRDVVYAQDVSEGIKVTPYFIPSSALLDYFRVLIIAIRFVWGMIRTKATLCRFHAP